MCVLAFLFCEARFKRYINRFKWTVIEISKIVSCKTSINFLGNIFQVWGSFRDLGCCSGKYFGRWTSRDIPWLIVGGFFLGFFWRFLFFGFLSAWFGLVYFFFCEWLNLKAKLCCFGVGAEIRGDFNFILSH